MLSTNTNPIIQGESAITTGDTSTTVANMTANINPQASTISIIISPGNVETLNKVENNAATQADIQSFFAKVLGTAGDLGMTCYGTPTAKTTTEEAAK